MLSLKASLDPNSPMIHPKQKLIIPPPAFSATAHPAPPSPVPVSPSRSPALKPKRAPTYTTLSDVREVKERQPSSSSWKFPQTPQKTPDLSDSEFSWQSPQSSTRTSAQPPFMDYRESSLIPLDFQLRLGEAPPEYEKTRRASNISEGALYSPKTLQGRRYHDNDKRPSPPPVSPNMQPIPPLSPHLLPMPPISPHMQSMPPPSRSPKPFMHRKNSDYRRPSHEPTSPPLQPLPEITRSPKELPVREDSEYSRKDSDYREALPEPAMLPPSAITSDTDLLYNANRPGSQDYSTARFSQSTSQSSVICTDQEQENFERKIFADSIILCEVYASQEPVSNLANSCDSRGTHIDYTQPDLEQPGEWKMVDVGERYEGCRSRH